jgi:hypothetical protein
MNNSNYFYKYIKYKNKYKNLKGGTIKNIGFDFDGVIHRNVGPDNGKDSRKPIALSIEHIFREIHDKIFNYHCHNYNIFIITGRGKKSRSSIYGYLNSCGLNEEIIPEANIKTIGGDGNKVGMAIQLKLDEYYDDSTSEIRKFIERKCELLAINPNFRLFQTVPECSGTEGAIVEK